MNGQSLHPGTLSSHRPGLASLLGLARPLACRGIALLALATPVGAQVVTQAEVSVSQPAEAPPYENEGGRTADANASGAPGTPASARRLARWGHVLSWGLIIALAGIFGAVVIVVFSRRFRSYILRGPRQTTRYVDAWRMYRLPPDSDADDQGANNDDPAGKPPAN